MSESSTYMVRAIELAKQAGSEGNLPIGAVIVLDGEIAAEGRNAIWFPRFDATRHAEMEALRAVPQGLWLRAREMTLYTSLEPCVMCFGAILLHRIGRVIFGSADPFGGARLHREQLPQYFRDRLVETVWDGPTGPTEADQLNERVMELVLTRRAQNG
jgi:tRNA(adenine34) deaminase